MDDALVDGVDAFIDGGNLSMDEGKALKVGEDVSIDREHALMDGEDVLMNDCCFGGW